MKRSPPHTISHISIHTFSLCKQGSEVFEGVDAGGGTRQKEGMKAVLFFVVGSVAVDSGGGG